MGTLRADVTPGEQMPTGYAPAYRDWMRDVAVCYPIGLHLLVRWTRSAYYWLVLVGWTGQMRPVEPVDESPNFIEFSPAYVRFREDIGMMLISVEVDDYDLLHSEKFPKMHQVGKLAFYWEDDDG